MYHISYTIYHVPYTIPHKSPDRCVRVHSTSFGAGPRSRRRGAGPPHEDPLKFRAPQLAGFTWNYLRAHIYIYIYYIYIDLDIDIDIDVYIYVMHTIHVYTYFGVQSIYIRPTLGYLEPKG